MSKNMYGVPESATEAEYHAYYDWRLNYVPADPSWRNFLAWRERRKALIEAGKKLPRTAELTLPGDNPRHHGPKGGKPHRYESFEEMAAHLCRKDQDDIARSVRRSQARVELELLRRGIGCGKASVIR